MSIKKTTHFAATVLTEIRLNKQILNISINAAYNLIHSKSFPVIRIGNSFRVPKEPFYEWMKSSHTIMN